MTPTWYVVDNDYTPIAEIQFREDQIDALPQVIVLDNVKYSLDSSGGFYRRDAASGDPSRRKLPGAANPARHDARLGSVEPSSYA